MRHIAMSGCAATEFWAAMAGCLSVSCFGFKLEPLPTREESSEACVETSDGHFQGIATIYIGPDPTCL